MPFSAAAGFTITATAPENKQQSEIRGVDRAVLVQVNVADDRMRLWRQTEGLATVGGCR
jgi:hypothetical protein